MTDTEAIVARHYAVPLRQGPHAIVIGEVCHTDNQLWPCDARVLAAALAAAEASHIETAKSLDQHRRRANAAEGDADALAVCLENADQMYATDPAVRESWHLWRRRVLEHHGKDSDRPPEPPAAHDARRQV